MATETTFSFEELVRAQVREEISKLLLNNQVPNLKGVVTEIKSCEVKLKPIDLSRQSGSHYQHSKYANAGTKNKEVKSAKTTSRCDGSKNVVPKVEVVTLDTDEDDSQAMIGDTMPVSPKPSSNRTNSPALNKDCAEASSFKKIGKVEGLSNIGTSSCPPVSYKTEDHQYETGISNAFSQNTKVVDSLLPESNHKARTKRRGSRRPSKKAKTTDASENDVVPCNVCGKSYRSGHGIQVHMASHSRELEHDCNVCLKRHVYYLGKIKRQKYSSMCTLHCKFCKTAALFNLNI